MHKIGNKKSPVEELFLKCMVAPDSFSARWVLLVILYTLHCKNMCAFKVACCMRHAHTSQARRSSTSTTQVHLKCDIFSKRV